ncbi:EF-P lysine aminoacylase EpmA [Lentisphaerota bacterium ZTH]|nr:EF-P lysine aminoacylase GenX [Lentisphaerota bacterium]WET07640.1 EF-P lysine aminoacylase EpmA [Lentisphaerota bacterium ZTH]
MTINELKNLKARLEVRAGLISAVRAFFDKNGFVEVSTPVLIKAPAPEEYIEGIPAASGFLRTSPELQMKQLVCAGYEKIYQIGPCFRKDEFGSRHRPEFTMLEWYHAGSDYLELMAFTAELIREAVHKVTGNDELIYHGYKLDMSKQPEIIDVSQAYERFTSMTSKQAEQRGEFDTLMVECIEPELGKGGMTFLKDYPASRAALARLKRHEPGLAERWELYIAGMELANAYSELTDPVEQRKRFTQARKVRAENGLVDYPESESFFAALDKGMPECAGCALGIDRLVMLLTNSTVISSVLPDF